MNTRQKCTPLPRPHNWNWVTRILQDPCAVKVSEHQSRGPGKYARTEWFRPCETSQQYAQQLTDLLQFYKVYQPSQCFIDADSKARYPPLTNLRDLQQLWARPYSTVPFMGAGQNSLSGPSKDIESFLIYGDNTHNNFNVCHPISETPIDRFQVLPDYGNPQRVEHIIPPWIRPGEPTRDYVRQVDANLRLQNWQNNNIINRA